MSESDTFIRKVKNNLFFIKIWERNNKARPVRKEQMVLANKILDTVDINAPNIYYLCIPVHKNLGDQAQRYCIERWIKSSYPEWNIIALPTWPFYESSFKKRFTGMVKQSDLIVIQSGYCTTDRHYDHPVHKYIVKNFPDNRILILPQTVKFWVDRHGYQTGRIYSRHKKLLFMARDKQSFEYARKFMPDTPMLLYPDIVTTLIGTMQFTEKKNGVLICVRNDGEKKYTEEQINELKKRFDQRSICCDISDTNSDLPLEELLRQFRSELEKTLRFFAGHQVVITDRYHGMVFSMIANVPVVVLETNDHKVKTGTEWFKGIYDGAYFNAGSIDEAYQLADKLLQENPDIKNSAYFKAEYYDKLKDRFEEVVDNA